MTEVRLVTWSLDDLDLLRQLNAPEVRRHTGGSETDEQVVARNDRYARMSDTGPSRMYVITLPDGSRVGSVGHWERQWRGAWVWEMGWAVLPAYQGRGLATAAVRAAAAEARARRTHRFAHAYPSVDNPASNAVCRRVGFTLLGETDFEYPPGRLMRSNDWRLDLTGGRPRSAGDPGAVQVRGGQLGT